jgi:hypothetical protein
LNWFSVVGDYGADGGGAANSLILTYNAYSAYVLRVYGTADPSINELIVFKTRSG